MKELINLEEALPKGLNPADLTQALKEKKKHLIPIQPPENLQKFSTVSMRAWKLIIQIKPTIRKDDKGGTEVNAIPETDLFEQETQSFDFDTTRILTII